MVEEGAVEGQFQPRDQLQWGVGAAFLPMAPYQPVSLEDCLPRGAWGFPFLHTHTHDNVSTQLKAQKGFSTNSWSPLSLQLSLPCYSVLRIQTALVYQLCLLNSGSWLGFGWVSLPSMWSGNSLKTVSWDNDRVHLTCFLSLKNYCLFLLDAQLLQRRQWHPTPVLLPEKSNGRRSLVGCSPWGR